MAKLMDPNSGTKAGGSTRERAQMRVLTDQMRVLADQMRILAEMARGRRIESDANGLRIGGRKVPVGDLRDLLSRDLVEIEGGGGATPKRYVITDRGRARLRRERAERQRRAAAEAADSGALAVHSPFRDQHMTIEQDAGGKLARQPKRRWINREESPLLVLSRRRDRKGQRLISDRQVAAGERLRTDFELAGMAPRVTASWDAMPVSARKSAGYRDLDPGEVQIVARQRFNRAMEALGGGLADVVTYVCCLTEGLEQTERRLGWPPRSGKVVLGIALDRLGDHYGLQKITKTVN